MQTNRPVERANRSCHAGRFEILSDRHAKHEAHGSSTLIGAFHWTISFTLFPNDQNSQTHNSHKFAISTRPQYSQSYNTPSFRNFTFFKSSSISQIHDNCMFSVFISSRNSKHGHIQHFTTSVNFTIPQHHKNHKFEKFTHAGFHNMRVFKNLQLSQSNKLHKTHRKIKFTKLTITQFTKSQDCNSE